MIFGKKAEEKKAAESETSQGQAIIDPKDPIDKRFLVPLPEDIDPVRISKISEVKTVWKKGIREMEMIFENHVNRICDIFEDKTLEYDHVRQ